MNFLWIYLGEKGGGALMHVHMYGNTLPAFTTEPVNGCLRNLVGMKCSWSGTCIKMFWPYLPRGGSRVRLKRSQGGPLLQKTSSDRKATATNRIHSNDLVACNMKLLFLVPFCSLIFDPWILTEVLIVLRWVINAPWGSSCF